MLPVILSHELVHPFKFWHQHEICEGMHTGNELYRLCTTYQPQERQKAFCLVIALAEQGVQVCMTRRRTEYKVWVSLRTSPPASTLLEVMAACEKPLNSSPLAEAQKP